MKHLMIAIALLSATLLAQSGPRSSGMFRPAPLRPTAPAIASSIAPASSPGKPIPRTNFVLGSKESPHEDRFPGRSPLFLGGPGLVEGERYSILRQIDDPNRENSSPEQRKQPSPTSVPSTRMSAGSPCIRSINGTSIATFDFSCDAGHPRRYRRALQGKASRSPSAPSTLPSSPSAPLHRRPRDTSSAAKDFVGVLGTGQVVYTDFGTTKGAKPGDYLLILRGYAPDDLNQIDRASESLPSGAEADSVVNPAHIKADADAHLPQHVLGEMLVLNATPESSTAIITRSLAEMQLGDVIEAEDGQPATAAAKPAQECGLTSRLHQLLRLHPHACRDSREVPEKKQ